MADFEIMMQEVAAQQQIKWDAYSTEDFEEMEKSIWKN